jgi:hypothetical protein
MVKEGARRVGRGGFMLMDLTNSTKGRKLKKWLTNYHVINCSYSFQNAAPPPSTAVSHNGALNALSGSMLIMLMA